MAEHIRPHDGQQEKGRRFAKDELVDWLNEHHPDTLSSLFQGADHMRKVYVGDEVHIRGIIEFSNHCRKDCLYCGLRKSNDHLVRYRMSLEQIFQAAQEARRLDFRTVILQSGEDPAYPVEDLLTLVKRMKRELNLAITLCIGERTFEEYKKFKDAGADRYLLKFETSSPSLFGRLKPDSTYSERFRCLEWLKELGYQVGSGNIVGLPGQTSESLAEDILLFKALDLDMIGIGPFIPHPNTPLAGTFPGDLERTLKVVALARMVTRNTHIPATTAVGTIDPGGRQKALQCGANIIMPNATPKEFRKHYQIYPNKICLDETPQNCRFCIEAMVTSLGRKIGSGFGDTLRRLDQAPSRGEKGQWPAGSP
jgi:biotin synthase